MTQCDYCKQEMREADSCLPLVYRSVNGKLYDALPYTNNDSVPRCHDCGALAGRYHHHGCAMECCPCCDGQMIACGCLMTAVEGTPAALAALRVFTVTENSVPFHRVLELLMAAKAAALVADRIRYKYLPTNGPHFRAMNLSLHDLDVAICAITPLWNGGRAYVPSEQSAWETDDVLLAWLDQRLAQAKPSIASRFPHVGNAELMDDYFATLLEYQTWTNLAAVASDDGSRLRRRREAALRRELLDRLEPEMRARRLPLETYHDK